MKIKYLVAEDVVLSTSEGEITVVGGEAEVTAEQAAFLLKEFPRWWAKPNTTPVLTKKEPEAVEPATEKPVSEGYSSGKKKR